MQLRLTIFLLSLLLLCWQLMVLMHELGHVAGAWLTGGTVTRVVVHPLAVTRTDVAPNPQPAIVVWMGPLLGSLLPLAGYWCARRLRPPVPQLLQFLAGFCLVANGAYIGIGSLSGIGDCGEMLRTGTPRWAMQCSGLLAVLVGLLLWHRLGSFRTLWQHPEVIGARLTGVTVGLLVSLWLLQLRLTAAG